MGESVGSLQFELNRLAGLLVGGVPSVGEATAANRIAGTSGLQVVGALNEFLSVPVRQWLGLDGVCRLLAQRFGGAGAWSATADGVGAAHALSMVASLPSPAYVSDYLDAYADGYARQP
jgi:hypothetical protein